ncbi:hypothetical protein CU254_41135 (plasmid) [Amycolatopsis sp. AA4]|uniref:hypothetical protein n=1 Tax=Actinomycetes TaxID=1760 RepID=UPI0001B56166|nr:MULTISPECIES: hypothetical protein [Actinomycetes]ATY16998.1 hypothetical protein CU254_41135 [Amycolatopsis sp. AA4]EFL12513.1 predicted protein [Streptomyces sp. AA4]
MGKRSARRRKARIEAYKAEHGISKHTEAARAVDRERERAADLDRVLGGIRRGGEGKTSAQASIPLPHKAELTTAMLWSSRNGGSRDKTDPAMNLAIARWFASQAEFKPVVVDADTTGSTTASLVLAWLVRKAGSDDPSRIAEWLARHGRVLTAPQRAVLDGLLGEPGLRGDLNRPGRELDDDHALNLGLLDHVLAGPGRTTLAVWPGADGATSHLAVMLLQQWEGEHGPLTVDSADAGTSLRQRGNATYRRTAAILVSWVVEVAGSEDPQRIAARLAEFGLVLTAAQQATLADLVADPCLRVPRDARRTVLGPETYLRLLGAVLAAPPQEHETVVNRDRP